MDLHPHALSSGSSGHAHSTEHPMTTPRPHASTPPQLLPQVTDVDTKDKFSQVKIKLPQGKAEGVKIGGSVAINGTCLTVTEVQKDTLSFDIMMETLRATNLGELGSGSVVNFERAARMGEEIGGHNVSGHVHTTATITAVEQSPNNRRVVMTLRDEAWAKYLFPKGFISVDGCRCVRACVYVRVEDCMCAPWSRTHIG